MSFASLLDHRVFVRSVSDAGSDDDQGGVELDTDDGDPFDAALQPKRARELANQADAGQPVSDWTLYCLPRPLRAGDALIHDPAECGAINDLPSMRLDINGVRPSPGRGHHLELDARLVGTATSIPTSPAGS